MLNFVKIGDELYKTRKALGFSQEFVAELIGVTERTIHNIEYAVTVPDIDTIFKLWDLYELPRDFLFDCYSRNSDMSAMLLIHKERLKAAKTEIINT